MEIKNHRLTGDKVGAYKATTKTSGSFKEGMPDTVIIHYTASPTASSAINVLLDKKIMASAHIVVDVDGTVTQMADFNIITWHAGRSEYKGRDKFNNLSIGIEIVNSGPITEKGGRYYDVYNNEYPASQVVKAKHRFNPNFADYWHKYTDIQLKVVKEICELLKANYGIKYILGHEEISVGRKHDPGPAYPLDEMRDSVLLGPVAGGVTAAPTAFKAKDAAFVSVSKLNIRKAPDAASEKVAEPLLNGTKLIVLEDAGEWCKVATRIKGWVSSKFLDLDNSDDFYDASVIAGNGINIRSGAGPDFDKVAEALPAGTKLMIVEQLNGWYQVFAPISGYVLKKYLSKPDTGA